METAGSVGASGEGVSVGVSGEGREDGAVSLRRDRENEKKGPPKEETEKKKPKFGESIVSHASTIVSHQEKR